MPVKVQDGPARAFDPEIVFVSFSKSGPASHAKISARLSSFNKGPRRSPFARKPLAISCLCDATFSLQARAARIFCGRRLNMDAAPPKQARATQREQKTRQDIQGQRSDRPEKLAVGLPRRRGLPRGAGRCTQVERMRADTTALDECMGKWGAHRRCEEGALRRATSAPAAPEQQRPHPARLPGEILQVTP
jgi:hypothetical protein